jgi:hypothetical protein
MGGMHPSIGSSSQSQHFRVASHGQASVVPPRDWAIPTLDDLLNMSPESIATQSDNTLMTILYQNHVHVGITNTRSELVDRVTRLIEEERRDREQDAESRRTEDEESLGMQIEERHGVNPESRGLCVICQDDEANIVVINCGCVSLSISLLALD